MIRAAVRLAGAAPLLLAVACAVTPETPREPPAVGADLSALPARLVADQAAVRSVRGLARIQYDGPRGSGSASQAIVVALPDRARLETLSPVGTSLLVLTIRGERLQVHSLARHEYGVGRATRETLGRLAQTPVPPGPLLRLLVGLPPLPLREGDPRLRLERDGGEVRAESVDGSYWQRLWMGPDSHRVARGELGEAAGPLLSFRFGERRAQEDIAFPFAIRIEDTRGGSVLDVRYESVRLNEPVEAALFDLPRPSNGRTRMLDLGGAPD